MTQKSVFYLDFFSVFFLKTEHIGRKPLFAQIDLERGRKVLKISIFSQTVS